MKLIGIAILLLAAQTAYLYNGGPRGGYAFYNIRYCAIAFDLPIALVGLAYECFRVNIPQFLKNRAGGERKESGV